MNKEDFKFILAKNKLTQSDGAYITGVCVRQVRSWCLGRYPVPQYAALIMSAYDEGLISNEWLADKIANGFPLAAPKQQVKDEPKPHVAAEQHNKNSFLPNWLVEMEVELDDLDRLMRKL